MLWAVDPTVSGSVLVRPRQLDGAHPVGFDDPVTDELVLDPKDPSTPGGWRDYPGYTQLRAPGCYGYQVDTAAGQASSSSVRWGRPSPNNPLDQ